MKPYSPDVKPFMRDVAVNVLANLIAAGIIYLFGVAIGLFPHNPTAVRNVAGSLVMVAGAFLFARSFGKATLAKGDRSSRSALAGLLTIGVAYFVMGKASSNKTIDVIMTVAFVAAFVALVATMHKARRF